MLQVLGLPSSSNPKYPLQEDPKNGRGLKLVVFLKSYILRALYNVAILSMANDGDEEAMNLWIQMKAQLAEHEEFGNDVCRQIANCLISRCFANDPLLQVADTTRLCNWLQDATNRQVTNAFDDNFDEHVLEEWTDTIRQRKYHQIKALLPSQDMLAVLRTMDGDVKQLKLFCKELLFAGTVVLLFIRNRPLVRQCTFADLPSFNRHFRDVPLNSRNHTILRSGDEHVPELENRMLFHNTNFMAIALLIMPASANKGKIMDMSSRLTQSKTYKHGGGVFASGFQRRRTIFETLTGLPRGQRGVRTIPPESPRDKRKLSEDKSEIVTGAQKKLIGHVDSTHEIAQFCEDMHFERFAASSTDTAAFAEGILDAYSNNDCLGQLEHQIIVGCPSNFHETEDDEDKEDEEVDVDKQEEEEEEDNDDDSSLAPSSK